MNIVCAFQPWLCVTTCLSTNSQTVSSVRVASCYYEDICGYSLDKTEGRSLVRVASTMLNIISNVYLPVKGSICNNLLKQTKARTCVDLIKIYLRKIWVIIMSQWYFILLPCILALTVTKGTLKFGFSVGPQEAYACCKSSACLKTGSKKFCSCFGFSAVWE